MVKNKIPKLRKDVIEVDDRWLQNTLHVIDFELGISFKMHRGPSEVSKIMEPTWLSSNGFNDVVAHSIVIKL